MAAEDVHGKVYAFILLADGSFNSRPLMAGMVKLDPSDGVTYKRLEAAAALNGHRFWAKKIVEEGDHLPLDEVESKFKLLVEEFQSKYEEKIGKLMSSGVPCLNKIASGLTFVDRAASIAVFSPETVQRFWVLRDNPSVASRLPYNALPTLPSEEANSSLSPTSPSPSCPSPPLPALSSTSPASPKEVSPSPKEVSPSLKEVSPSLPGESVTPTPSPEVPKGGNTDQFALAVKEIGLGDVSVLNSTMELIIVDDVSGLGEQEEGCQVEVPTIDLDREVEDVLQQVESLPIADRASKVYSSLVATIKRLQGSHRKQESMIRSLNQLSAAQDLRLQSYQADSAEDIAEALSPALKKAVGDVRKEMKKEIREELEEMKKVMAEEARTSTQELAGIKSSLSTLSTKVVELGHLGQSTMGAAALINESLKASGIVVKEDPLSQVDIPEVLLQVNSKLNDPASVPTPPGKVDLPLKGTLKSSNNSSSDLDASRTPCLQSSPSSGTPSPFKAPFKAPRQQSRWSPVPEPNPLVNHKSLVPGKGIKRNLVSRDISMEFGGSQRVGAGSRSGVSGNARKSSAVPQLSEAQIHQKLKQLGASAGSRKQSRRE